MRPLSRTSCGACHKLHLDEKQEYCDNKLKETLTLLLSARRKQVEAVKAKLNTFFTHCQQEGLEVHA